MVQLRAPFLAGLALVLAASCDSSSGAGPNAVTVPVGTNGSWTGALDGATLVQINLLEQPDPSAESPGFQISGLGFLTLGGCTQSVSVSGSGDGTDYSITLTGNGGNAYTIELAGQLTEGLLDGAFALTSGEVTEACLPTTGGLFTIGRTAVDGVNGTFTGSWTGAGSVTLRTSQTRGLVYGAVRWTGYACARDASFKGTRLGNTVQGTLTPLFGSLSSYDVTMTWDPAGSMSGGFTVTAVSPGSPCRQGDLGTFSLGSISSPDTGPGGSAVRLTVLEVNPEDGEPSVVFRYEEQGD